MTMKTGGYPGGRSVSDETLHLAQVVGEEQLLVHRLPHCPMGMTV